jgi:hypothetical protein
VYKYSTNIVLYIYTIYKYSIVKIQYKYTNIRLQRGAGLRQGKDVMFLKEIHC